MKVFGFCLIFFGSTTLLFAEKLDNLQTLNNEFDLLFDKITTVKLHVEEEMEGIEKYEEISVAKRLETSGWCFMEDIQGIIDDMEKYELPNFDSPQMKVLIKNDPRRMLKLEYIRELKSFLATFEKRLLIVAEAKPTNGGKMSEEMEKGIEILGNMAQKMEEKMDEYKVTNLNRVIKEKKEQIDKLAKEIEALQGILAYPEEFKKQMGQANQKAIMAKKCENVRDKFDKDQLRQLIKQHANMEEKYKKMNAFETLVFGGQKLIKNMWDLLTTPTDKSVSNAKQKWLIILTMVKVLGFRPELKRRHLEAGDANANKKGTKKIGIWTNWWKRLKGGGGIFRPKGKKLDFEQIMKALTDATLDLIYGLIVEYDKLKNEIKFGKHLKIENLEENIKQFEDQYMEKEIAQHNSCSPKH